ncbi:MAG: hypothetical protein LBF50_06685 [Azoarcus sp.]|jgi:hypothetical protein|nr:hypothetical protein [Azoarcus sp.]
MSTYDYIVCSYPLPGVAHPEKLKFKTNSFRTWNENYEIRETGTLWLQLYETVYRIPSNAQGLGLLADVVTRKEARWVRYRFTGMIEFHDDENIFSASFVQGRIGVVERLDKRNRNE